MALRWTWTGPVLGHPWLVVDVGGVEYAVEARRIRHLTPGAVASGAERLDGVSYPDVDLRALFGLSLATGAGRVVFVDDGAGRRAALRVDAVRDLIRLDVGECVPLPWVYTGRERRWFDGLARAGDRVIVLLSIAGVLGGVAETVAVEA